MSLLSASGAKERVVFLGVESRARLVSEKELAYDGYRRFS